MVLRIADGGHAYARRMIDVTPPSSDDYPTLALLHNATHEPHFHVTAGVLSTRDDERGSTGGRLVARRDGAVGMASFSTQQIDLADRLWVDLGIHPDHLGDGTTEALIDGIAAHAASGSVKSCWMAIREDYLESWPDPIELGFAEVHRTFGGGFFLADDRRYGADLPAGVTLVRAGDVDERHLQALFTDVRGDKVTAPPTITAASTTLDLDDAVEDASVVAVLDGALVGLSVAECSSLGAWHSAFGVRAEHRRRGIGRALLAATLSGLQAGQVSFLNTAGASSDAAYLGVLAVAGREARA
jgi:GNAT superfamily N-acetyltransferase